jgi:hypothetical protein
MTRTGQTVQLNASIPKVLMENLKIIAKRENRSISNLVSVLLIEEIKHLEKLKVTIGGREVNVRAD